METTHEKRGPRAQYRPKEYPPVSALLTKMGRSILRATSKRTGMSQSDVVEALLRLHGKDLPAKVV